MRQRELLPWNKTWEQWCFSTENCWCSNMSNGHHSMNPMNRYPLHEQRYQQTEMRGFWLSLHFPCVFCHLFEEPNKLHFYRNINHFLSSKPHKNAVKKARFFLHVIMDVCPKQEHWTCQTTFETTLYLLHVWISFPWTAEFQGRGRMHTRISHATLEQGCKQCTS